MRTWIAGLLLLFLGNCVPAVPRDDLRGKEPFSFREHEIHSPLGDDSPTDSLLASVEKSLAYLEKKRKSPGGLPTNSGEKFSSGHVYRSLSLFRDILSAAPDKAELDRRVRENFAFYELRREGSSPSVLLTGYFEPVLEGSLVADGEYRYPLYGQSQSRAVG